MLVNDNNKSSSKANLISAILFYGITMKAAQQPTGLIGRSNGLAY